MEQAQRKFKKAGKLTRAAEFIPAGKLTYCLGNCPYRSAVRERQAVVCGLHRGMTRGLLDVIDPKAKLSAFVPKDPDAAGCEITLRGPLAKEGAAREVGGGDLLVGRL